MGTIDFGRLLNYGLATILALSFHEAAHALLAFLRGDMTARRAGRLTLNPLAHIDLLGTLILPLLAIVLRLPLLGWAKPVPVNPRYFKYPRLDQMLVAIAGPGANLLLGGLSVLILVAYETHGQGVLPKGSFFFPLLELCDALVWVNVYLAFFNLLPIPPLDGASIVEFILPSEIAEKYHRVIAPYGSYLLILIIASGGLRWLPHLAEAFVDAMIFSLRSFLA